MPGLITSMSGRDQLAFASSTITAAGAAARAFSLSSHAHTVAPLASSAAAVARPVRPRPSTATILPATSGMRMGCGTGALVLSELERGKADQRQHGGDDPEANDDGGFGPPLLLEVMVKRRHAEHA